jgi:hypothetical protein
MMPLGACTAGQTSFVHLLLGDRPVQVVTKIVCPPLEAPPEAAVVALEQANKDHPEVGKWSTKLEKHLEQLDGCP